MRALETYLVPRLRLQVRRGDRAGGQSRRLGQLAQEACRRFFYYTMNIISYGQFWHVLCFMLADQLLDRRASRDAGASCGFGGRQSEKPS
jgi:hypothetical protein